MPNQIYVAVEFDTYSVDTLATATLRIANRGKPALTITVTGVVYPYDEVLITPVKLGQTIGSVTTGLPVRATPNAGTIDFMLDAAINWDWVSTKYIWPGAAFRVYYGTSATGNRSDLTLVYTGRVADLRHDTKKASVQITDASLDLDKPLIENFYNDTFAEGLRGRPRPRVWGRVLNIAPPIIEQATYTYEVTFGNGTQVLDDITEVRGGDVPWEEVASTPLQGQFAEDLGTGRLALGSVTDGMDIRCDAQAVGWDSLKTPDLLSEISLEKGVAVDSAAMSSWRSNGGGDLIGYFADPENPVNTLNAFDEIAGANASFWGFAQPSGELFGKAHAPPDATGVITLDQTNIVSLSVPQQLPSAWRIRSEWARNWNPVSQAASGVTDTEAKNFQSTGTVFEPHFEDPATQDVQPRALDAPLVRTLCWRYTGAYDVQSRLLAVWGTRYEPRQAVNITARIDANAVSLYDTVTLDYMMLAGQFRIISILWYFGDETCLADLELWGTSGYNPPNFPSNSGLKGHAFLVSGTFTIPSPSVKISFLGAGGGASGTGAADASGGSGAMGVKYLTGLTVGNTLTVTVGGSGRGGGFTTDNGQSGGSSGVSSGTQTISTLLAPGGNGAVADTPGTGGSIATGGDINGIGNGGGSYGGGIPSLRLGNYGWGGFPGFNYYRGFNAGSGGPGLVLIEWAEADTGMTCEFRGSSVTGSSAFTIPSASLKVTIIGAGGGAGASAGGGSGAAAVKYLTGLTVGQTLSYAVGAGGSAGGSGATSTVSSGTGSISTITAPGGNGGSGATGGTGGAVATGGDINAVGNGGGGYGGGVPSSTLGNAGWGGFPGSNLYGTGVGGGANGSILFEWTQ